MSTLITVTMARNSSKVFRNVVATKLYQHVCRNSRCSSTFMLPQRQRTLISDHQTRSIDPITNYSPVCYFSHAPTPNTSTSPDLNDDDDGVNNNNNNNDRLAETDLHSELDCLYRKIDIEVKGHDPAVINSYEKFVRMAAEGFDVKIGRVFTPPKVTTRYTLLKSVHIYKKHRVQYENRTHYRVLELVYLTGSTADTILEYIQRNLPEGMAMKVTKHRIESLPEHVNVSIE